jgi:hypothetical protein
MAALQVPGRWEDVSPQWVSAVLAARFPGAEVAEVTLQWVSDGTNRRARFGLSYGSVPGPGTVFMKAEGIHREVHARNGNLFNEPRLYGSGAHLPVDHPDPYGVVMDEEALDWIVVMEDVSLRGGDPHNSTRPLSVDQVANGMRGLARLHRAYRGFTAHTHPGLAWVQDWAPTEGFQSGLRKRVPLGLERMAKRLPALIAHMTADEIVDQWVRYVALLAHDPTLLHADAHVCNTYVLPGDDVGFLDWQVVRRGHWSQDAGYFLQGALTEADRRAADRDLITAYLADFDSAADVASSWLWYRASAAYGLAIWLSTLGTDGYQPHDVSGELAARYAAAFVELDTLGAITVLETVPERTGS